MKKPDVKKYSFLKPRPGYIVLKECEEDKSIGLVSSGQSESRAYAHVVALPVKSELKLGDLVVYNEYEGQEFYKMGKVKEDGLIIIKEENILCIVK